LVFVMIVVTLLLVGLTMALPSVLQQGQREREEEVIFRGTQYARAVALFRRQFNRYPESVEELLQTNRMRFLRQEYTDPLDPKGKWRFIHANAAGVLLDSKSQSLEPSQPGLGGSLGGGMDQAPATPSGTSSQESSLSTPPKDQTGLEASFTSSQTDNPILGAFIVGVAPTSQARSIRLWNKRDHYYEWEFLGIDMGLFGVQVGLPRPEPSTQTPSAPPGVPVPPPPPNFGDSR
jgi:type II secretory pathway pseudopilin PulG